MIKLSVKDIRIYWFTFLINFVFWTVMAPAAIQNSDIYLMLPIGFGLLITMIPLGNDMRDGRDILYASLPIKRNRIVMARYLSSFFLAAAAFMWIILLGLVIERYLPGLGGELLDRLSIESMAVLALITTLIISIYLPLVYRFGFSAVITGGIAVITLVMGGFWLVSSYLISSNSGLLDIQMPAGSNIFKTLIDNSLFYNLDKIMDYYGRGISLTLIFLVIAAAITLSMVVSIRLFSRREF